MRDVKNGFENLKLQIVLVILSVSSFMYIRMKQIIKFTHPTKYFS
jgi:hypothetical protein